MSLCPGAAEVTFRARKAGSEAFYGYDILVDGVPVGTVYEQETTERMWRWRATVGDVSRTAETRRLATRRALEAAR